MDEIATLDATAQAELVRRCDASPLELVDAAIARIERLDPKLNAVVTKLFDRARDRARAHMPEAPFRGVPFLLKDLHAAQKGVRMTQGSAFLKDYVPDYDTELVRRVEAAGFIVVGRSSTPEFGIAPTTEPALFGPCRNPWDLSRSSGGSSGGSAAAVAARIVPMAHASDGGGSIRIPASCCGVFGLKPTRARVTSAPKVGEGIGGLTAELCVSVSVRDTAAFLDVVSGPAPGDPYFAPAPERPFTGEVRREPGRLRIALMIEPTNGAPVDAECRSAARSAADLCADLGHVVEEARLPLSDPAGFSSSFVTVWATGAAVNLATAERAVGRRPTKDDVEPMTWALAELSRSSSPADFVMALRNLSQCAREMATLFERFDVLLTPTLATPPVELGALESPATDPLRGFIKAGSYAAFTMHFNVTGQPAMSVPLYVSEAGLPIGVQFVGRYADEATLLRLAAQLEQARPWTGRVPAL